MTKGVRLSKYARGRAVFMSRGKALALKALSTRRQRRHQLIVLAEKIAGR